MTSRQVPGRRDMTEADVAHILWHGALNRQLSTFGGQQVFVLEGPGAPDPAAEPCVPPQPGACNDESMPGPQRTPRKGRRLRILFAQNENATVVVSAIDLDSDT